MLLPSGYILYMQYYNPFIYERSKSRRGKIYKNSAKMPLVSAAAQKRCVKKAGTRMDVCRFVTAHRFCCPCALLYVARKGMCARETLVGFPLHVKSCARRQALLRSKSACTKKEGHPYGCPSFLVREAGLEPARA